MASDRLTVVDAAPDPRDPRLPVAAQGLGEARPVRIGDGVFLGTGATVLPGVSIGARSLVAAGAVVAESVPENCVVGGNPARVIRHFDRARGAWVDGPPG
ncbi:MAG: hypothetical protein HZB46_12955 [Solirubrobacterales bacterium]|nr:hypothetical protein [Solirubrobacterales bacterium]